MAITTKDQLLNAMGNSSQTFIINKASIASATAMQAMSLWLATGTPAPGVAPTTAAVCTKALTGALQFKNPVSANSYLSRMMLMSSVTLTDIQVHDRLAHMGGLSGTVTTAQTANVDVSGSGSNMVNRRGASDYSDVQWWVEIYTAIGTTAQTLTVTYTNAAGTSGQTTTVTIGATTNSQNRASRAIPIIGNGGEFIQSIQSVQLAGSTGTAGNFGVTATRLLTGLPLGVAYGSILADYKDLGFPRVHDDACLFLICFPGSTSTGALYGSAKLVQG